MLELILLVVCLILSLWIVALYGLEWRHKAKEQKAHNLATQYESVVNTCLMIFSLSRQIVLEEKDFKFQEVKPHILLVEVIRNEDWVKFLFDFKRKRVIVTNLSEVTEGRQEQITLKIKDNKIEENTLMAFFGIPNQHKEQKLKKLIEVASAKQKQILAKASPNEILKEVVLPFMMRKVNVDDKEDATALITFFAAIMDEDEEKEEHKETKEDA